MFSHEHISHTPKEIDNILSIKLKNKDYVYEKYYCNSAGHKESKLISRSYLAEILKRFDPSTEEFGEHIRKNFKGYLYLDSKDGKYSIYRCDQNEEFYIYVKNSDNFVLLFCCDCK
jgi:hypothetical protein